MFVLNDLETRKKKEGENSVKKKIFVFPFV